MSIIRDLVSRIDELERRLDRLADVEIVPFNIGCRVFNNADQTTTTSTTKTLEFNTERFDTDSMHSTSANTSRITINTPGKYLVVGGITWEANGTGQRQLFLRVNASTSIAITELGATPSASLIVRQSLATIYEFSVADYVELRCRQTSLGDLDITSNSDFSPIFAAYRLA